jgi:hypothetical protein
MKYKCTNGAETNSINNHSFSEKSPQTEFNYFKSMRGQ